MTAHNTPTTAPETQDGKALAKGAKAGVLLAPSVLAIGLAYAAPYVPINIAFNKQAQDSVATTPAPHHENADRIGVYGPSEDLIYVIQSKDCDSESVQDLERLMAEQNTAFLCEPKFAP